MLSLSSCVFWHMDFERCFPCSMGMFPLLERSILNRFSTLSMYVDCERPSNQIDPNSQNIGCFAKVFLGKLIRQPNLHSLKCRNVIFDYKYVIYIQNQKYNYAPTNLLVDPRFILVLYEAITLYCFIKTDVPAPWCFLQFINGFLKLTYFLAIHGCKDSFPQWKFD